MPAHSARPGKLPVLALLAAVTTAVLVACSHPAGPPAGVKGFDAAGVSVGTGSGFSPAQWQTIRANGFRVFLTDPIRWSSECAGAGCHTPVSGCRIDPAAVAQIQDAAAVGIDYAVYTRNPRCLPAAISGLPGSLRAHLSFAVIDVEPGPSVPVTNALIQRVRALGQTPVIYSFKSAWDQIMHGSTAFSGYPLQDGQVTDFSQAFPAAYPARFPQLTPVAAAFGGWSGYPQIAQQQCCTDLRGPAGTVGSPGDQVDLDAVSQSWLASLPRHAVARHGA